MPGTLLLDRRAGRLREVARGGPDVVRRRARYRRRPDRLVGRAPGHGARSPTVGIQFEPTMIRQFAQASQPTCAPLLSAKASGRACASPSRPARPTWPRAGRRSRRKAGRPSACAPSILARQVVRDRLAVDGELLSPQCEKASHHDGIANHDRSPDRRRKPSWRGSSSKRAGPPAEGSRPKCSRRDPSITWPAEGVQHLGRSSRSRCWHKGLPYPRCRRAASRSGPARRRRSGRPSRLGKKYMSVEFRALEERVTKGGVREVLRAYVDAVGVGQQPRSMTRPPLRSAPAPAGASRRWTRYGCRP